MVISRRFIAFLALALALVGCGRSTKLDDYFPDRRLDYKKSREAAANLEIPPNLTAVPFDEALDIPPPSGTATYSDYAGTQARRQSVAPGGEEVLPSVAGVTVERAGQRRWLVVTAPPRAVWPRLIAFWRAQGIVLTEQDPSAGVMQTDWLENRADIRDDFITRMVRKVAEGLYATSTRDRYRVRIEAGVKPGTTEIYLTHRGMEERLARTAWGDDTGTVWEPSGSDPDKEAIMLRRLMVYFGTSEDEAQRLVAQEGQSVTPATRPQAQVVARDGIPMLIVPEPYREAWQRIGWVLDRTGFAVEDRNAEQGVFFVRYEDPDRAREKKPGLIARLAFWRSKAPAPLGQYRVHLREQGTATQVTIYNQAGELDRSATAERILTLLAEDYGR